jgi:hypothetical protein
MVEKYMERQALKANAVWTQDFEGTPNWTVAANPNLELHKWKVTDAEAYMADGWGSFTPPEEGGGWYMFPIADSANDPNKWMMIDILGHVLRTETDAEYEAALANLPHVLESYVQFDDIDLSSLNNPLLMWEQSYRGFNPHLITQYVDVSVDGGVTWITQEVNQDVEHGKHAEYYPTLLIPDIANEPAASIRFRWNHNRTNAQTPAEVPLGWGWSIDDIMFVEGEQYDVKHIESSMNFFAYIDYHVAGGAGYYHYSGHFGQIPVDQMGTDYSFMFFNTIVENKGVAEITPLVNVQVINPVGSTVYNATVTGASLPSGAIDTIDIMEPEFLLNAPIEIGEYQVKVQVSIEGQEDANVDDNSYETKFFVTEDVYARDLDNITSSLALDSYIGLGNDEEMLGANYFINKTTEILSVDVFVQSSTTPGNTIQAQLLSVVGEEYQPFAVSEPLVIGESHLGTWVNFTFTDETNVNVDLAAEGNEEILAAVKMFYTATDIPDGQTSSISIGVDQSTNFGVWSFAYYILGNDGWGWNVGGFGGGKALGIRLNLPYEGNYVKEDMMANFKVYPNPTQDILKIETQSQKSILNIYSVDGKLVRNIEVSNNAEINVSEFATGVYTVVLTDENGNVGTQRFIKN